MSLLVLGAVVPSLLVAWGAAFVIRRLALRWGLVDRPGERKIHTQPVPLGGGLAIWLGVVTPFAVGQGLLWLIEAGTIPAESLPELVRPHLAGLAAQSVRLWLLLGAATVLLVLGLVDDRRGLPWQLRIVAQAAVAAALVFAWEGWRLTAFLDLPLVTAALSVLWIVGLVNSFNMLDNMDGLSAGVAAIAAAILAAALLQTPAPGSAAPQLFVAGFLLVLTGALMGFLWHNHSPARIFMGDAGSYFIGFCLAMATIMATFAGEGRPRHAILAPLCVLAIPLYDTASVIIIRLRQGRSPFVGDKSHLSHRLVERGLNKRAAVWTIYLASITCGLGALILPQVNTTGAIVVIAMTVCVIALIAVLEFAGGQGRKSE